MGDRRLVITYCRSSAASASTRHVPRPGLKVDVTGRLLHTRHTTWPASKPTTGFPGSYAGSRTAAPRQSVVGLHLNETSSASTSEILRDANAPPNGHLRIVGALRAFVGESPVPGAFADTGLGVVEEQLREERFARGIQEPGPNRCVLLDQFFPVIPGQAFGDEFEQANEFFWLEGNCQFRALPAQPCRQAAMKRRVFLQAARHQVGEVLGCVSMAATEPQQGG
jgi:hypothetical protein